MPAKQVTCSFVSKTNQLYYKVYLSVKNTCIAMIIFPCTDIREGFFFVLVLNNENKITNYICI